jgi:hypothetical protein
VNLPFSFQPLKPTSQDDYNILFDGEVVGTFFWKKNHPRPTDKVAIVRNLVGDVAIVPNETHAIQWIIKTWKEYGDPHFTRVEQFTRV